MGCCSAVAVGTGLAATVGARGVSVGVFAGVAAGETGIDGVRVGVASVQAAKPKRPMARVKGTIKPPRIKPIIPMSYSAPMAT